MQRFITYLLAAVLFVFGMITLFLSSSIIFERFGIREKEGNFVLFIIIANFIASIIYLFAAYGVLKTKLFTAKILYFSIAVLVAAFASLPVHFSSVGIYETKTIFAMIFRITLTCLFAVAAYFMISKNKKAGI